MEAQEVSQDPMAEVDESLPDDFSKRVATKIMGTAERERDPDAALKLIAHLIIRNMGKKNRIRHFLGSMDVLLADEETQRYAALSYISLVIQSDIDTKYENYISDLLDTMIYDHINITKPEIELHFNKRRRFSYYAKHLGDVFIRMIDLNSDLYEIISTLFSDITRKEMTLEQQQKENQEGSRRITAMRDETPKAVKKLFDEIVDYIHARGQFHSDSLNQQNPNEFMAILADRIRGTRRYVIQDIINRQALARKKEVEKELSERLANAEDIILAKDSFKKALNLFWTEKLYNFKYLSVEKVRVTIQVSGIVIGIFFFLIGYLNIYGMKWWEGVVVASGMYIFSRFMCSRKSFLRFFPDDVSKELEVVVGSFTPTLRRMSKDQMDNFMVRQVKDPGNVEFLPLLSEFVKYLFAVMPDRKSAIVEIDELSEIMENMELDIARTIRQVASQI